ncbi:conserved domain protein [delta proteobacterium NaphS2]|nr:conserved domain protein [delta proteobacterium NaphS2]
MHNIESRNGPQCLMRHVVDTVSGVVRMLFSGSGCKIQRVLAQTKESVNEGNSLAHALGRHPRIFSDVYINMVRAGEASGSLELAFPKLTRMGGDLAPSKVSGVALVSIHAPAWGATCKDLLIIQRLQVSIHAPAWGATLLRQRQAFASSFQSTPPHGGRQELAPTAQPSSCFNPRPRMGGDSTRSFSSMASAGFNPRPRMGGDWQDRPMRCRWLVSIHAPAWGATHPPQ